MVIRRKDPKYRRKGARAAEDRPTWTAERRRTLASGGDVVQDGIEFGATPSPWTLVRLYVEDHRSKSGRCPILSDFSWHVDGGTRAAGQKFFYCLQVKRAYACYRSAIRTWMCVHVRSSVR